MSDNLRAPGSQGVSRGKSESEKNAAPLQSGNLGGAEKVSGHIATPVTPGRTKGNHNCIK